LRNQQGGGSPRLVGAVSKRMESYGGGVRAGAGIKVVAEKDGERLETSTTGDGQYEFLAIGPGTWKLSLTGPGILHDPEHERKEPSTVPVSGCESRYLSAVADGHIRGRVTDKDGHPIAGVPVQVFDFFAARKEFNWLKFAEAVTSQDGSYDIGRLPPQDYVLGVNAQTFHDDTAYPPAYYGSITRDDAKRISLKEAEQIDGIDLVLKPPRKEATVILEARYEDGTIATATGIPEHRSASDPTDTSSMGASAEDVNGIQRAYASGLAGPNPDGKLRLSLWAGETYIFKVFRFGSGPMIANHDGSIRANIKQWEGTSGPIRLTDAETTIRIVIHEKPLGGK
jgi:hypothetical protein